MFGACVLVGYTIHVPFLLYGGSLVGLTLEWTDLFDSGHVMQRDLVSCSEEQQIRSG